MREKAKYLEIRDFVAMQIIKGRLKSGDKLFTKTFFINKFKVNPKYVDRAYEKMIEENLIITKEDNYYLNFDENMVRKLINQFANEITNDYLYEMEEIGMDFDKVYKFLTTRLNAHG
ncbi:MAG: hypothetical protein Q4B36_05430 [Tissierellia bacterium]|nr:hypothetical protein [Tissierellia bacterium]